jgi:hypothetical protein
MSPENRMPPSAIKGIPDFASALATFCTALICGTPTPATIRVVQMDPGPMPTLTASAPWSTSALAAFACCNIAADDLRFGKCLLDPFDAVEHALRVPVGRIDYHDVGAGFDQGGCAFFSAFADANRRAHA